MGAIFYLEGRDFLLRGPAPIVVLLILLAIGYAGWSGDRWRDSQLSNLEAFSAEQMAELDAWRADLMGIEQGLVEPSPYAANPMNIGFPAVLPPGALGDFAVGHSDLHPSSGEISPWRNLSSLFGHYQFDNPQVLATGAFDVALVVILVMPLLMIAVSFDVLSRESNRGTLSVSLCAPVALSRLVWTRLLFRNGVLWLVATAAMLALLFLNDQGGDRLARGGWWILVSLAYGGFWLALIALVVAAFRQATQTAALLAGLWFLLALAVPGTVSTATEAAYPTPSRLAFLSEIRGAQGATNRELAAVTDTFLTDHPELTVGDEGVPSFFRAAFLSNEAARTATASIVQGYEEARAARAETLDWAQYLSPAIIAQRLLDQLAGADLERQHRFQAQARQALFELSAEVGPAVVSRNRLSLAEFDQLSAFAFADRSLPEVRADLGAPLAVLLALTLLIGFIAQYRLRDEEAWT